MFVLITEQQTCTRCPRAFGFPNQILYCADDAKKKIEISLIQEFGSKDERQDSSYELFGYEEKICGS